MKAINKITSLLMLCMFLISCMGFTVVSHFCGSCNIVSQETVLFSYTDIEEQSSCNNESSSCCSQECHTTPTTNHKLDNKCCTNYEFKYFHVDDYEATNPNFNFKKPVTPLFSNVLYTPKSVILDNDYNKFTHNIFVEELKGVNRLSVICSFLL